MDPTGRVERVVADGNGVLSKTWFKEVTLETKVSYKYPDFAYENSNPQEKKNSKISSSHTRRNTATRERKGPLNVALLSPSRKNDLSRIGSTDKD